MAKKEGLVRNIKIGGFRLIHRHTRDILGLLKDSFELIDERIKGRYIHYPFMGLIKVKDYKPADDISDSTNIYSRKEYLKMMDEQIKRYMKK